MLLMNNFSFDSFQTSSLVSDDTPTSFIATRFFATPITETFVAPPVIWIEHPEQDPVSFYENKAHYEAVVLKSESEIEPPSGENWFDWNESTPRARLDSR